MALKLVRKKKVKATVASQKKSEVDKFGDAIEAQLRSLKGEKIKVGRGTLKSWLGDGTEYGCKLVLAPVVGKMPLYGVSAIMVDDSAKNPGEKELNELLKTVRDGKMNNRIYAAIRAAKKGKAKPKGK